VCNQTNNPQSRTSLSYVQADVQVRYQPINEKFIVNLMGGTTVVVANSNGPIGQPKRLLDQRVEVVGRAWAFGQ